MKPRFCTVECESASMRPSRLFVIVWLALGCAAAADAVAREIGIVPIGEQEMFVDRGTPHAISYGRVTVAVHVESLNSRRAWLGIVVFNDTDRAVTVMDSGIRAATSGRALEVELAGDILKRERRRQNWQKAGAGLAAGLDAYAAGQQGTYTQRGSFSGTAQSRHGTSTFSGSYSGSGFDAEANRRARADAADRARNLFDGLEAEHSQRRGSLERELFRSQTIPPGGSHMGRLQIELPRRARGAGQQIDIAVEAGGQTHRFVAFVDGSGSLVAPTPLSPPTAHGVSPPTSPAVAQPMAPTPAQTDHGSKSAPHPTTDNRQTTQVRTGSVVTPRILTISLQSIVAEDGSPKDYVFFDVEWTALGSSASDAEDVRGRLVLLDETGRARVAMPWSLSASDLRHARFIERAVGFELLSLGSAASWLRQTRVDQMKAAFER